MDGVKSLDVQHQRPVGVMGADDHTAHRETGEIRLDTGNKGPAGAVVAGAPVTTKPISVVREMAEC
jgi:hypothetical protein